MSKELGKTGMMGVYDEKTHQIYTERLDSVARNKADFVTQRLPQLPSPRLIVDFGCLTGTVAALVKQMYPRDQIEGIDINSRYIQQANETYGNKGVTYLTKGAEEPLPYSDNTISAFSTLSVLHEIYSYNEFQTEPVVNLLRDMHRSLRLGGRVIIRESAKPDNPDERLYITLNKTSGSNPQDVESLFQTPPSELSQAALMKRFLLQFKPLQNPSLQEQVTPLDDNQYAMPAWLVSEFFRKRKNTVTPEFFASEMEEQTSAFTAEDLKQLAHQAGFQDGKIDVISTFEKGFFGAVEPEALTLSDSHGRVVQQNERFPSHLHGVLIK